MLQSSIDGSYYIDIFKDHQKRETKGKTFLEFCTDVLTVKSDGKTLLELRMSIEPKHSWFMTDSEVTFREWHDSIQHIIDLMAKRKKGLILKLRFFA